ncbi:hypothetical protein [Thermoplasma volcanium GSS1]|uniref:MFS transporter n=1 Tax=Thermoplasma volcanium (strain ATCC 51530 / DSM 4299 / JCM 9571 / NBRC 15438 / GSS1) TaxID=273116 RepID=Q97C78_THEVO|nr:MFS transporter [Thermoplasma volcanium]BAB59367.1 hypothetical protein [Thermoplasma volcanium GSS1]
MPVVHPTVHRKPRILSNFSDLSLYYISYNLFAFSNGLFGTFINIFFFSKFNLISVVEYQAAIQGTQTLMFVFSGYLIRILNAKYVYSIGNYARSLIIFALILAKGPLFNPIIFGLIYGIPSGIFWSGNNTLSQAVTRSKDRFGFLSTNSTIAGAAGLVAPLLAGFIISISYGRGLERYSTDFLISALLLIIAGTVAIAIREKGEGRWKYRARNTIIGRDEKYSKFKTYFFLSNILTITVSTIVPLYIFSLTKSYVLIGFFGTFLSLVNLISNATVVSLRRIVPNISQISIVVVMLSSLLYFIHVWNNVASAYVASALIIYFMVPLNNSAMSNFMGFLDGVQRTAVYWINREYYLVSGRIFSFAVLAVLSSLGFPIGLLMFSLPVFSLSVLGFIKVSK